MDARGKFGEHKKMHKSSSRKLISKWKRGADIWREDPGEVERQIIRTFLRTNSELQ